MKIGKFILLLGAIFIAISLFGCKPECDLSGNVSRLRKDAFYGESESYRVDFYPELCESPMIADGKICDAKKIVVIKLRVKNGETGKFKVTFTTDKEYSDEFTFSAVNDCFVSSIEVNKLPDKPFIATITHDDEGENVNVESSVKKSTVSYETALTNAYLHKKEYVDNLSVNGVFNGEIYVRLITEGDSNFWYVGFITSRQTVCVLLSSDGKVLEEKTVNNPSFNN